jgi:hypothetical protein
MKPTTSHNNPPTINNPILTMRELRRYKYIPAIGPEPVIVIVTPNQLAKSGKVNLTANQPDSKSAINIYTVLYNANMFISL